MLKISHAPTSEQSKKAPITVMYRDESFFVAHTVWARLGIKSPDGLYSHLNLFLASLPDASQKELFELHQIAYNISQGDMALDKKIDAYADVVGKMSKLLTWEALLTFCESNGLVPVDPELPTVNDTGNSNDNTFLQREGYEAVVYSMLMKFLMPIFGPLCNLASKTCGSDSKELISIRILDKSDWVKAEPYARLMRYSFAYAARENSGISSLAIHKRISTNDIPYLILGHILIRRLCIYPTKKVLGEPHVNIAAFISNHIKNGILENFKNNPYDDKFKKESEGSDIEDSSYVDRFRKSQDVPEWALLIEEYALLNVDKKLKELGIYSAENAAYVKDLSARINANQNFQIVAEIHITICALILRRVTAPQVLRHIEDKTAYCNVVAICNLYLQIKGYPTLASLLVAVEEHRSLGQMDKSALEIKMFTVPNKELIRQTHEIYPFIKQSLVKGKTNYLLNYADILDKRLNGSDWKTITNPENLSNELLSLFIAEAKH